MDVRSSIGTASSKEEYMNAMANQPDLLGDVDGLAISSRSEPTGFVFDLSKPLSYNFEKFYFSKSSHYGKDRRFHIFCAVAVLLLMKVIQVFLMMPQE